MFRRINSVPGTLLESRLASRIPSSELKTLHRRGTFIRVPAGRQAMIEGRVGRECMVVVDGSFVVERDGDRVADLKSGDFMGEIALLTNRPRNATVTATDDSVVYAFSRREFTSLLRECPALDAHVRSAADKRALVG
jgi:CRP-like cAMP-binding protein